MSNINWNEGAMPYLKKQFEKGRAVLFLGAGFSCDSKNKKGLSPPLGTELAKLLIKECGHSYQNEPLPIAYESAQNMLGTAALNAFLTSHYQIEEFDSWYHIVKEMAWHRIYTINIDNLIQKIYFSKSKQALKTIVYPNNMEERDQLFGELQCVHLHGHIGFLGKKLTFTLSEFAEHTTKPNPWYQQLMDDLYSTPFIFIGTNIEEPQFQHYLNLRESRFHGEREHRPKSYIINPNISQVRKRTFLARNIQPVECTANEFFTSLKDEVTFSNYDLDVVRKTVFPNIIFSDSISGPVDTLNRYYEHILPDKLPINERSKGESFFLGAEPTWNDIGKEHDANRKINKVLIKELDNDSSDSFECFVLHGPAGSGKSTTLMRIAYNIALAGKTVYFAKGTERSDLSPIPKTCMKIKNKRVFVFIDNFNRQLGPINQFKEELRSASNLTLVLCERTNAYYSRSYTIEELGPKEYRMPDLCQDDVIQIINKLQKNHFLGALRTKKRSDQIHEFMVRASSQLLVAMKEATSGKGFETILRSEFMDLSEKAQLAYLICCLAVDSGSPGVYRRHLLASLDETDLKKTALLEDMLKGIIIPANESGTLLKPRHRLIAHWISTEIAKFDVKYQAISKYLMKISSDIVPDEVRRRSPTYLAYRGMINSERLWETLEKNEDAIFALYEHLQSYYSNDFLFWLHYGMVYIKAGYYDMAENYLNQSLALYPNSYHTLHQLGILYIKQAMKHRNPVAVKDKADEGIKILIGQIRVRGDYDSYPYAAYLGHVSRWYCHAGRSLISSDDWEELRQISSEALKKYPREEYIIEACNKVESRYLSRVVH